MTHFVNCDTREFPDRCANIQACGGIDLKEEYLTAFANRLAKLREEKGLSKKRLSELCGLSSSVVSKYESGERGPTMLSLVELSDFFCCTIDYLIGRE